MKHLSFFLLVLFLLPYYSCKKDCSEPETIIDTLYINGDENSVKDYLSTTIGSYWIYQDYHEDTSGNFYPFGITDSVFVSNDTIIHSDTFALLSQWGVSLISLPFICRDSLDYLVDQHGIIWFSSTNFTDTLRIYDYPFLHIAYKMSDQDSLISITCGTFNTYNYKQYMHDTDCPDTLRYSNTFYAKNVGMVKQNEFYTSTFCLPEQQYIETRLERYHIEQ